jgi:hypothetical protein
VTCILRIDAELLQHFAPLIGIDEHLAREQHAQRLILGEPHPRFGRAGGIYRASASASRSISIGPAIPAPAAASTLLLRGRAEDGLGELDPHHRLVDRVVARLALGLEHGDIMLLLELAHRIGIERDAHELPHGAARQPLGGEALLEKLHERPAPHLREVFPRDEEAGRIILAAGKGRGDIALLPLAGGELRERFVDQLRVEVGAFIGHGSK